MALVRPRGGQLQRPDKPYKGGHEARRCHYGGRQGKTPQATGHDLRYPHPTRAGSVGVRDLGLEYANPHWAMAVRHVDLRDDMLTGRVRATAGVREKMHPRCRIFSRVVARALLENPVPSLLAKDNVHGHYPATHGSRAGGIPIWARVPAMSLGR